MAGCSGWAKGVIGENMEENIGDFKIEISVVFDVVSQMPAGGF